MPSIPNSYFPAFMLIELTLCCTGETFQLPWQDQDQHQRKHYPNTHSKQYVSPPSACNSPMQIPNRVIPLLQSWYNPGPLRQCSVSSTTRECHPMPPVH